jgi:pimeloyl-ACP methyl ester carboxylesterase
MSNIGIVLLTGAGFDNSIWKDVAVKVTVPYVAVDYPERHNGTAASLLAFDDYIDGALKQIKGLKADKIILVGHSIGGVVMMRLGELLGDRVVGRVAIAAAIPYSGGSFLSCLPQPKRFIMGAVIRLMGTKVPPSAIRTGLCSDLDDAQAQKIINAFTPESRALYTTPVDYTPQTLPSLYIVTTKDSEFGVAAQKSMASRIGAEMTEIESGHLPMIGHPDKTASAIISFIEKL